MTLGLFDPDPPDLPLDPLPAQTESQLARVLRDMRQEFKRTGLAQSRALSRGLFLTYKVPEDGSAFLIVARARGEPPPSAHEAEIVARDAGWFDRCTIEAVTHPDGREMFRLTLGSKESKDPKVPAAERDAWINEILWLDARRGDFWTREPALGLRQAHLRALADRDLRSEVEHYRRIYACSESSQSA